MRKEVVWAIIAGIGFGLVIAYGAWRVNLTLNQQNNKTAPSPTPIPTGTSEFKITLNKPENEDVVTEDSTLVTGITRAFSSIVISAEGEDYFTQANEKGGFEVAVNLEAGVNQIKITVFDPNGSASSEKVLVVYSSAFEATPNSKAKAYLGVVTDIADNTIQIKTNTSEIRQTSTNKDDVIVVKDDGKTTKTVKFTDVAIGDFIVAMGYVGPNLVLSAQRILITPQITDPEIAVDLGVGKDVITAKTTQVYLYEDGKVVKEKLTSIEDEDKVITVSATVNKKATLRTVFIISQNLTE